MAPSETSASTTSPTLQRCLSCGRAAPGRTHPALILRYLSRTDPSPPETPTLVPRVPLQGKCPWSLGQMADPPKLQLPTEGENLGPAISGDS